MINEINYSEVLDDLRESNKEWAIVSMYDVLVLKEESGSGFFFDISSWKLACYFEFGQCPEEMAIEAAQNYMMEDIDREGYWNITHLLKHFPDDYFEGRLVERSYFEIIYTEAAFVCTVEEREQQNKEHEEMMKSFPFS